MHLLSEVSCAVEMCAPCEGNKRNMRSGSHIFMALCVFFLEQVKMYRSVGLHGPETSQADVCFCLRYEQVPLRSSSSSSKLNPLCSGYMLPN